MLQGCSLKGGGSNLQGCSARVDPMLQGCSLRGSQICRGVVPGWIRCCRGVVLEGFNIA